MLRILARSFLFSGWLFVALGIASIVWAVLDNSPLRWGVGLGGGALLPTGAAFVLAGRFIRRQDTSDVLARGIAGTAQVLSIRDTGITIANVNAVFALRSIVTIPDREPYEAEARAVFPRHAWGNIQPAMVVAVKVDPDDPQRVVVDPSRPLGTPTGAGAGAQPGATLGGPGTQVVQYSTADILARGVPSRGQLISIVPTGMSAGQVVAHLAPHEADDPVVQVRFTYEGLGGAPMETDVHVRVPDGKAGLLVTGAEIPVRFLPTQPDIASIDWDRL